MVHNVKNRSSTMETKTHSNTQRPIVYNRLSWTESALCKDTPEDSSSTACYLLSCTEAVWKKVRKDTF